MATKRTTKKRTVDLTAWHECNCCICHTATPSWEPGLCLLVWRRHGKRTGKTTKVPPNVHEIETLVKQVSYGSGCLISLFKSNFSGSQMYGSVVLKSKQGFFTATNNVETSHTNGSTLTLTASDFCWQGFHYWLRDNKAVHWEPRPNNCIVHVQALSWGQPE